MDLVHGAVAITTLAGARKVLEPFYTKILSAAGEAVGNRISDWANERRAINLAIVVQRAQEKARDNGLDPSQIPLKVIHPMLEKASLEEEPDLQDLWSGLLANASRPDGGVTSAFIEILNQLSRHDALFLLGIRDQILAENTHPMQSKLRTDILKRSEFYEFNFLTIWSAAGLATAGTEIIYEIDRGTERDLKRIADKKAIELSITNLIRLGLVEKRTRFNIMVPDEVMMERAKYYSSNEQVPYKEDHTYALTELGVQFVEACCAPPE